MKLKNLLKTAKSGFQSLQKIMAQGHGSNFRTWMGSIALGQLLIVTALVLVSSNSVVGLVSNAQESGSGSLFNKYLSRVKTPSQVFTLPPRDPVNPFNPSLPYSDPNSVFGSKGASGSTATGIPAGNATGTNPDSSRQQGTNSSSKTKASDTHYYAPCSTSNFVGSGPNGCPGTATPTCKDWSGNPATCEPTNQSTGSQTASGACYYTTYFMGKPVQVPCNDSNNTQSQTTQQGQWECLPPAMPNGAGGCTDVNGDSVLPTWVPSTNNQTVSKGSTPTCDLYGSDVYSDGLGNCIDPVSGNILGTDQITNKTLYNPIDGNTYSYICNDKGENCKLVSTYSTSSPNPSSPSTTTQQGQWECLPPAMPNGAGGCTDVNGDSVLPTWVPSSDTGNTSNTPTTSSSGGHTFTTCPNGYTYNTSTGQCDIETYSVNSSGNVVGSDGHTLSFDEKLQECAKGPNASKVDYNTCANTVQEAANRGFCDPPANPEDCLRHEQQYQKDLDWFAANGFDASTPTTHEGFISNLYGGGGGGGGSACGFDDPVLCGLMNLLRGD